MSGITQFSREDIKRKICTALDILFLRDEFLLKNFAHERSVTHKIAEYLQAQFPGWHVDCEYNRCRTGRSKRTSERKLIYPDIIVHHRGTDDNLLVIEVKMRKDRRTVKSDEERLKQYTSKKSKFKYRFGILIQFDGLKKPKLILFRDGIKEG